MDYTDYWSPGTKVFVTITTSRTTAIHSVSSASCQIVGSWNEAINLIKDNLNENRFWLDKVTIFTKPRLCEKCLKHATQPLVFDPVEYPEECLCKVLSESPCKVHN